MLNRKRTLPLGLVKEAKDHMRARHEMSHRVQSRVLQNGCYKRLDTPRASNRYLEESRKVAQYNFDRRSFAANDYLDIHLAQVHAGPVSRSFIALPVPCGNYV